MRHLLSLPCLESPTLPIAVGPASTYDPRFLCPARLLYQKPLISRDGIIDQSKGVDIYVPIVYSYCWCVECTRIKG